ncbi:mCG64458 [Mus musculus]|nr:mCG64458 [Mus musculus]
MKIDTGVKYKLKSTVPFTFPSEDIKLYVQWLPGRNGDSELVSSDDLFIMVSPFSEIYATFTWLCCQTSEPDITLIGMCYLKLVIWNPVH